MAKAGEAGARALGYAADLGRTDRRAGRRDGRRGIPSLTELPAGMASVTCAYQELLVQEMFGQAEGLHGQYNAIRRAGVGRLRSQAAAIAAARDVVDQQTKELAAAREPLTPEELMPKNTDEEGRSAESIRFRREVARARRITAAERSLDAANSALRADLDREEQLWQELDAKLQGVRDLVGKLRELYVLRVSSYWDAVCTTHPNGRHLARMLSRPQLPLPAWVTAPIRGEDGYLDDKEEADG